MNIQDFLRFAGTMNPVNVCELPLSVAETEDRLGIEFEQYVEEGLGNCFIAVYDKDGRQFLLQSAESRASTAMGVVVKFRCNENNPRDTFAHMLDELLLEENELRWTNADFLGSEPISATDRSAINALLKSRSRVTTAVPTGYQDRSSSECSVT